MKWTKEKPTYEGWWWRCESWDCGESYDIVQIYKKDDKLYVTGYFDDEADACVDDIKSFPGSRIRTYWSESAIEKPKWDRSSG